MNLNSNFAITIATGFLSLLFLTSCQSHEQNTDEAFESFKEGKLMSEANDSSSKETNDKLIKTDTIKTGKIKTEIIKENQNEWEKFKLEIEKKILVNKNKIKEIKNIPGADTKLLRKVSSLEKDNNNLRKKMDEYKEEEKMHWENFKTMMDHNVNDIGIELKDITTNNKK